MYKIVILTLIFFNISIATAQNQEIKNDPDFIEFKKEYIEYFSSDEFYKHEFLDKSFRQNLPKNNRWMNDSDFKIWIEKNLDKTTFKSIEEALAKKRDLFDSYEKNLHIKQKLYDKRGDLEERYGSKEFYVSFEKEVLDSLKPLQIEQIIKWKL